MKVLAADIGGTSTKMGVCDRSGQVERYREYPTEALQGGPHLMERLIANLAEYGEYDAIAISTAGQVDAAAGTIVYANGNIPNYAGTRIKDALEARFGKPVRVENDVNAAALGEACFGAARGYRDFLCLTFGTGIGGAIVLDGKLYRGADGVAAEFGHMFTHALGESGDAGKAAFYESYASTSALVRIAAGIDPLCADGRTFFDRVNQGDERMGAILQAWVSETAAGLASLIHIFNPPAIIVGGGVMEQEPLVRMVEKRTRELIMDSFQGVRILRAELGNKAGMLGAASLWMA
ncbi:ROK family protein [Paenibacillus methanolicus]|uniref:Putative NBD/HSP70 family sugar kinase n=1 Tax=Paenibacillus methanolicus TaxID=582686 RepID=A0A5S5C8V6_9BACL|nr:ROK family protein [Paenibacillus methanolicus]TYP74816.1 putative NBD/HSP70 family sugar kinase [Paenibacillus methanolicus]